MTKAGIAECIFEKVGFSKKDCQDVVETIFGTIKEALERGESVKLSGFGNFAVKEKKARMGRNPQTGEGITISSRRVVTFRPSQILKDTVNS